MGREAAQIFIVLSKQPVPDNLNLLEGGKRERQMGPRGVEVAGTLPRLSWGCEFEGREGRDN